MNKRERGRVSECLPETDYPGSVVSRPFSASASSPPSASDDTLTRPAPRFAGRGSDLRPIGAPEPGDLPRREGTPEPVEDDSDKPSPPVVVVMVAHDPGAWWEETLRSLANQTYANLTVVVLATPDDAPRMTGPGAVPHADGLEQRLHAVLPQAVLRRLPANVGFGPACNEVLETVRGAAFYLFSHDDVRLDPEVVEVLVDEAFRSNAGIVGPKLVHWDDPRRLIDVGCSVDKFGVPSPNVERGELDQEQHDAVRDVFYIPGGATLVRADLFSTLQGFDPGIDLIGEDLDLCWRAHVAGARVLVAPLARVAHREALDERRTAIERAGRKSLARRHRLRTMLVCYGFGHRLRVLPQALVLAVFRLLSALVIGHVAEARDVVGAWTGTLRAAPAIRRRRQILKAVRVVGDDEVRDMQVRGSAGANRFLRGQIDHGAEQSPLVQTAREIAGELEAGRSRITVGALAGVVLFVVLGSRELLTATIPAVGQFVPFRSGAFDLVQAYVAGYDPAGLGAPGVAPTAVGVAGLVGIFFLGAMGLVRHLAIVVLLPLGLIGMWRLVRRGGTRTQAVASVVVYAAVPVAANSVAGARWGALAFYAASPWLLRHLAGAAALDPFVDRAPAVADADPEVHDGFTPVPAALDTRATVRHALALAVVTALAALVEPTAVVLVAVIAVALAAGSALTGRVRDVPLLLGAGGGAAVLAAVLHLPWMLTLVTGGWADGTGTAAVPGLDRDAAAIVRFATGPIADSPLAWAFLVAAAVPVLIARGPRLEWAVRGWTVAVVSWGLVWAGSQGVLVGVLPAAEVLLAPAAAGLALAAAMGVAAFEQDLAEFHFGWRQVASVVGGAALAVAVLPMIVASASGRWGLSDGDFEQVLANLQSPSDDFRTLWIGDAAVVPLRGWPLEAAPLAERDRGRQLVYATTTGRGPDLANAWPGSRHGDTEALTGALEDLGTGDTSRVGARLAPMGIQYVLVPTRPAPAPFAPEDASQPDALIDALAGQLDLRRVDTAPGMQVYRNLAWSPASATLAGDRIEAGGRAVPSSGPSGTTWALLGAQLLAWTGTVVMLRRLRRRTPTVAGGTRDGR
jgi:GT2 family glycosyltransferase